MTFTITTPKGLRTIGPGHPCFIVAEMSANHDQNFEKAVSIIKAAAKAGADAIKLQTYTPDTLTIDSSKQWFRVDGKQNPKSWTSKTFYQLYQEAYTPWEWHAELKRVAEKNGLVFFSTPFDESAVDFLETLDVPFYKIASYEMTHVPLLRKVAQTGKPIIISAGFASQEEIELAVRTLRENGAKNIAFLHCVTQYSDNPDLSSINLATMLDLEKKYDIVKGFSDNNAGLTVPLQAAIMGACIIEKHFVINDNNKTFDSHFSADESEFAEMVQKIRESESIRGIVHYGPQNDAEKNNKRFRRSLFVVKDIQPGEKFTSENVRVIRPADGLEPRFYDDVLSATTTCFLERGTPLAKKHVSLFASDQPDEDCSLSLESIIPFTTINTSTTLIPATVDDAKFVYDIRNGDDVRSVSLTTQVIPYESHISFFATHFMQYAIVFFHDFRAGYVRKELSGSLSIALHPEFRGKGIGSAILSHLSGNAIIKTENDASLQAFRKAGWQIIGHYLEKK